MILNIIILLVSLALTAFFSYKNGFVYGYDEGIDEGYEQGLELGYIRGRRDGEMICDNSKAQSKKLTVKHLAPKKVATKKKSK